MFPGQPYRTGLAQVNLPMVVRLAERNGACASPVPLKQDRGRLQLNFQEHVSSSRTSLYFICMLVSGNPFALLRTLGSAMDANSEQRNRAHCPNPGHDQSIVMTSKIENVEIRVLNQDINPGYFEVLRVNSGKSGGNGDIFPQDSKKNLSNK